MVDAKNREIFCKAFIFLCTFLFAQLYSCSSSSSGMLSIGQLLVPYYILPRLQKKPK